MKDGTLIYLGVIVIIAVGFALAVRWAFPSDPPLPVDDVRPAAAYEGPGIPVLMCIRILPPPEARKGKIVHT